MYPYKRNLLHYLVLSLPDVDKTLLTYAIENGVKIAFDSYNLTPLDYLMAYEGANPIHSQIFSRLFFESLAELVDYSARGCTEIMIALARHHKQVFEKEGPSAYCSYLSGFTFDAQKYFYHKENLHVQGRDTWQAQQGIYPTARVRCSEAIY